MTDPRCGSMERDGFAITPSCLSESTVESLCGQFVEANHAQRNLLAVPAIHDLAWCRSPLAQLLTPSLGAKYPLSGEACLTKLQSSNWKVTWHQDPDNSRP